MLARVRKAVIAGVGAGVAAGMAVLLKAGTADHATISQAVGAFFAAAAAVGWTAWKVPNAA